MLNDCIRDEVKSHGNYIVDTRYVPFPMGRDDYETAVFKTDSKFNLLGKSTKMIEEHHSATQEEADRIHAEMINKYMKGV